MLEMGLWWGPSSPGGLSATSPVSAHFPHPPTSGVTRPVPGISNRHPHDRSTRRPTFFPRTLWAPRGRVGTAHQPRGAACLQGWAGTCAPDPLPAPGHLGGLGSRSQSPPLTPALLPCCDPGPRLRLISASIAADRRGFTQKCNRQRVWESLPLSAPHPSGSSSPDR